MSVPHPPIDLDAVLRQHGLERIDLCRVLDVSMVTVRFWVRGLRTISIAHCFAAEAKLGIPRWELRPDLWAPPVRPRREPAQRMLAKAE